MCGLMIGNVELGKVPRVAVIIDNLIPIETIVGLKDKGADILEIRFDLFSCELNQIVEYLENMRSRTDMPMIGTIRKTKENQNKRLIMFEQINPFVDAVDIEIDADIVREVITIFKGKTIIVSEHDFNKTPGISKLSETADTANNLGADIIKIATTAHCREDVTRLLLFAKERNENLVVIAMGEIGKVTRVVAPFFGSLFTYAFLSKCVAPGQFSLEQMAGEMKKYYPEIIN